MQQRKRQKARLETLWLKLHKEIEEAIDEEVKSSLIEAQDHVKMAIDELNHQI